jgi:cysteine desulfurase
MPTKGYFDYNATTPMCTEAIQAMTSALQHYGNPSSKYSLAKEGKRALELAREQVAKLVGSDADELVFTSGGTEANNWAIKGSLMARGALRPSSLPPHIIVSEIEHSSILEIASHLERLFGVEVSRIKPCADGAVSVQAIAQALRDNTQLVSVMMVNNEVGTIQPIAEIARLLRPKGVHFHVDGVQAVGKVLVNAHALGVDTLSFAAHKFHGPKGVGGLYIRKGVSVEPLLHGGGQERGLRGGTEAVPAIAAMGAAAEVARTSLPELVQRLLQLRLKLYQLLSERIADMSINGPQNPDLHAPNTLSLCVHGIRAEAVAALLDQMHGIQVSLGSACSNNKTVSLSHVLVAMGMSEQAIQSTLRVSIGRYTAEDDLVQFADALSAAVRTLRRISNTVQHEKTLAA